jgi:hypothetical protein
MGSSLPAILSLELGASWKYLHTLRKKYTRPLGANDEHINSSFEFCHPPAPGCCKAHRSMLYSSKNPSSTPSKSALGIPHGVRVPDCSKIKCNFPVKLRAQNSRMAKEF